jgi:hypothetical protein
MGLSDGVYFHLFSEPTLDFFEGSTGLRSTSSMPGNAHTLRLQGYCDRSSPRQV